MLSQTVIQQLMKDFNVSGAEVRACAVLLIAGRAATGGYPEVAWFTLADAVIYCLREADAAAIIAAESPFKRAAWNAMIGGAPAAIAA